MAANQRPAQGDGVGKPRKKRLRLWATAADPRKPWVQWIALLGIVIGVISGVATVVNRDAPAPNEPVGGLPRVEDPLASPQVVGPLRVRNPEVESESAGEGIRQTRASMPTLEVSLLNAGGQRTIFTSAQFEVLRYAVLEDCTLYAGAPLEVSATYDVVLPLDPPIGHVVEVPISQEIAGDEADRVAFRFGNPELGPNTNTGFLYLLAVRLIHSTDQLVLAAGEALVSLPGTASAAVVGPGEDADERCVSRNATMLADLISDDVAVSAELLDLAAELNR